MTLVLTTEIAVIAIAVAYTFVAMALQRKIVNAKLQRQMQYRLGNLSKELNEMVKGNASQEAIKAKQQELFPLMSKSMMSQFKPMFVVLPVFLVLYYWIMPSVFGADIQAVQSLFFLIVLVFGFAVSIAAMMYDKRKAKEEAGLETTTVQHAAQVR